MLGLRFVDEHAVDGEFKRTFREPVVSDNKLSGHLALITGELVIRLM